MKSRNELASAALPSPFSSSTVPKATDAIFEYSSEEALQEGRLSTLRVSPIKDICTRIGCRSSGVRPGVVTRHN
jgi:hypothetical protein